MPTKTSDESLQSRSAPPEIADDQAAAALLVYGYKKITGEMAKFIVGQDEVIEQLVIAVLAGGHWLLEGVPGLAKTAMVRTLSETMQLGFRRIQFTPDLMPSDITGTDIIQEDPTTGHRQFVFQKGPDLRANDPRGRDQSHAAEDAGGVARSDAGTLGHGRRPYASRCEEPFFVLATQNPIEQEGTYPLPEAQLRSLHVFGQRRLPEPRTGAADRRAHRPALPADASAGHSRPADPRVAKGRAQSAGAGSRHGFRALGDAAARQLLLALGRRRADAAGDLGGQRPELGQARLAAGR